MRIGALSRKANSFGLFRTSDSLLRIQRELVHMGSSPGQEKGSRRLLREIGKAEVLLGEEHDDVALASGADRRARRGLIGAGALLALGLANLLTMVFPPELLRTVTDRQESMAHIIAGCALLALGAVPARDFLFVHRFDKLKEEISDALMRARKGS